MDDVIAGRVDQSRVDQTPGKGMLGRRPIFPGEREKVRREDELRRQMNSDVVQGLILDADGE